MEIHYVGADAALPVETDAAVGDIKGSWIAVGSHSG